MKQTTNAHKLHKPNLYLGVFTSLFVGLGLSSCHAVNSTPEVQDCRPANYETRITHGADWDLVWSDEFDGTSLDRTKWTHEVNCAGGGNNELQCYVDTPENSYVENGKLHIKAIKEPVNGDISGDGYSGVMVDREYSSARLVSLNKGDWKFGRFEIRARLPYGQGIWPAIWMLPSEYVYGGWPHSGEIDIMEVVNLKTSDDANVLHATLHYVDDTQTPTGAGTSFTPKTDMADEFHTYSIEWESGEIRWYLDDLHYATQRQSSWMTCGGGVEKGFSKTSSVPFDQAQHLLLNLAIGGNWPGSPDETTILPQAMEVDFVRVFQCSADPKTGHGCAHVDPEAPLIK